jgi:hypothetical protein
MEGMVFMYGGVISPKIMLNDLWIYTPASESWNQKQRATLPTLVAAPNDKFKIDPEQGRPVFAPEPPDMRQMPAIDAGAKTLEEMDPDGGESPPNPDEMDPEESLPIYVTPPMPVLNPQQPYTLPKNTAADGMPSDGDAAAADGPAGAASSLLGGGKRLRRRRRMLSLMETEQTEKTENTVRQQQQTGRTVRRRERMTTSDGEKKSFTAIGTKKKMHPWGTLAPGLPSASALHGGRQSQGADPLHYVDDFWLFDVQSDSWLMINPHEGANPPRRSLHTAVAIGTKMIIFGGVTDNNMLLNDIWTYDVGTRMWEEVVVGNAQDRPLPREVRQFFLFFLLFLFTA